MKDHEILIETTALRIKYSDLNEREKQLYGKGISHGIEAAKQINWWKGFVTGIIFSVIILSILDVIF